MIRVLLVRKVGSHVTDSTYERPADLPIGPAVGMKIVLGKKTDERRVLVAEVVLPLGSKALPEVILEPDYGPYKAKAGEHKEAHTKACERLERQGFTLRETAAKRM